MLLALLGIFDILAGIFIFFLPSIAGFEFANIIAIVVLVKGLWSILSSAACQYYYDIFGWTDVFAGLIIILAFHGWPIMLFQFVWWIIILKGIYSLILALFH